MNHKRVLSLLLTLVLVVGLVPVTARAAELDCAPYANVEYEYSEDVTVGTIRYIRQLPDKEYFYDEYWPEHSFGSYVDPTNECGTAVISMSLSYVGVNLTPKALLEAHNGITTFYGWGPELQKPSVADGMERYINGEGKYSPVIIHLPNYSRRGHYVILAGQVSENVYIAVDPVKAETWEITINGRECWYLDKQDYIDEIGQYYNPEAVMPEPEPEPEPTQPQIPEHVCDQGAYLYDYAEHPHYSCYSCSVCGQVWVDTGVSNTCEDCAECLPTAPELTGMREIYTFEESAVFSWNSDNALGFSLEVERLEEDWTLCASAAAAESGLALSFTPGQYRARVYAYNDTGSSVSNYHRFTVVGYGENPFTDMDADGFYYDPAIWAYWDGITSGVTPNAFDPNGQCTRGQVVTFLWRLAGSPEPESAGTFEDVKEGKYYAKAAQWAAEQGITNGVDASHFAPNDTCTRSQVVTFLWRAAGKPEAVSTGHSFRDLKEDSFYVDAVLWAVESGITNGVTAQTFEPGTTCTRAQVVTFLYRYAGGE